MTGRRARRKHAGRCYGAAGAKSTRLMAMPVFDITVMLVIRILSKAAPPMARMPTNGALLSSALDDTPTTSKNASTAPAAFKASIRVVKEAMRLPG